MSDRYLQLVNTSLGRTVSRRVGLPTPPRLQRHRPGDPVIDGPVLLGTGSPDAPRDGDQALARAVADVLRAVEAEIVTSLADRVRQVVADAGLDAGVFNPDAGRDRRFKALVFDASRIEDVNALHDAWSFLSPSIRRLRRCGRVIVLGRPPESCPEPGAAIAQRALEGLTRSVGKEVRNGSTAQLLYVEPGAEARIESSLRFFLSPRSAFVSGQVVRIAGAGPVPELDWARPLAGQVALVTGASRGIGESITEVLAREGAHVVGVDIPAQAIELEAVTSRLGGSSLALDITEPQAPAEIVERLLADHGGVDVAVHNAGVTRDRSLARMSAEQWDGLMAVNLIAPQRINDELLRRDALRRPGRVIGVSSISGIAGNAGQANYATAKAGVIGLVQSWAPALAARGATINAVAPGLIETRMTAAMPLGLREGGRRLSSLGQGGLPVDVAETIAWLAGPGSDGITGNVVRVCGQSLIGA